MKARPEESIVVKVSRDIDYLTCPCCLEKGTLIRRDGTPINGKFQLLLFCTECLSYLRPYLETEAIDVEEEY